MGKSKRQNNVLKGYIAEEQVKKELQEKGWDVERLFKKENVSGYGWITTLREDRIERLLSKSNKRNKINKIIEEIQDLKEEGLFLPDFICRNGKEVSFLEVKNSDNKKYLLNPKQRKSIELLKKNLGIPTEVIIRTTTKEDIEEFHSIGEYRKIIKWIIIISIILFLLFGVFL